MSLTTEEILNLRICTQLPANPDEPLPTSNRLTCDSDAGPGRLAMPYSNLWVKGSKLNVLLIGGSPFVRSKVRQYALEWNNHSSVYLEFVETGPANVRVTFVPGGSWSYVGSYIMSIPQDQPTMNFGWFTDQTDDAEFSRTTIHEFGHTLGCVHEHQSPSAGIQWNRPLVYLYYKLTQGWTTEQVDINMFQQYSTTVAGASPFDPLSIMLYPIPAFLTLDGFSSQANDVLSTADKAFIKAVYAPTKVET